MGMEGWALVNLKLIFIKIYAKTYREIKMILDDLIDIKLSASNYRHYQSLGYKGKIGEIIKVFPKEYFSPKEYATNIMKITNNTYAIHHFDSSWLGELEIKKLRRGFKLRKIFGNTFGKISNNIIYGFEKYGILGPLKVFVEFKKKKKEKYV